MIRVKDRAQLISFMALLVSSFLIFFCLNESTMVKEGALLGSILILSNFNTKSIRDVFFSGVIAVFFLVTLLVSGRFFERGDYNIPYKFFIKFLHLFFATICGSAIKRLHQNQRKWVLLVAFGSIFVSCAVSVYYVLFVNGEAIRYRDLVGITQTVSFDQLYGISILLPPLLYFYAKHLKSMEHRAWYILFAVVALVCVLESLLTTAIVLVFCGIALGALMFLFSKSKQKSIFIIILFSLFILFLIFRTVIGDFAYNFIGKLDPLLQSRIGFLIDTICGTDHNNPYMMTRRLELANYSLSTFQSYPLFGVGIGGIRYGVIGYHQDWPDVLGVCGLIGTGFIVAAFLDIVHRTKKKVVDSADRTAFYLGCILFFVLGWFDPCIQLPELYALLVLLPNLSSLYKQERLVHENE